MSTRCLFALFVGLWDPVISTHGSRDGNVRFSNTPSPSPSEFLSRTFCYLILSVFLRIYFIGFTLNLMEVNIRNMFLEISYYKVFVLSLEFNRSLFQLVLYKYIHNFVLFVCTLYIIFSSSILYILNYFASTSVNHELFRSPKSSYKCIFRKQ